MEVDDIFLDIFVVPAFLILHSKTKVVLGKDGPCFIQCAQQSLRNNHSTQARHDLFTTQVWCLWDGCLAIKNGLLESLLLQGSLNGTHFGVDQMSFADVRWFWRISLVIVHCYCIVWLDVIQWPLYLPTSKKSHQTSHWVRLKPSQRKVLWWAMRNLKSECLGLEVSDVFLFENWTVEKKPGCLDLLRVYRGWYYPVIYAGYRNSLQGFWSELNWKWPHLELDFLKETTMSFCCLSAFYVGLSRRQRLQRSTAVMLAFSKRKCSYMGVS